MVTSADHLDAVHQLVRAAGDKKRKVLILLTGNGVLCTRESRFHALSKEASVYICRESLQEEGITEESTGLGLDRFITRDENAEIIEKSDRFLVF
jgi:hypothetical protein